MSYFNFLFPSTTSDLLPHKAFKNFAQYIDFSVLQNELLQYAIGRFIWDMPDYIPPYLPETYLLSRGNFAIFRDKKDPEKFVLVTGGNTGNYTANCWYTYYVGATLDGETYEGEVGKDCIVVLNDFFGMPDNSIFTYSRILSDLDACLSSNIKLSKNSRAFAVDSDALKENIAKAYKSLGDGDLFVFCANKNDLKKSDIFDVAGDHIQTIDLTDVKDSDKLQYICRTWDDIFTRCLMFKGIDAKTVNKAAQVNTDEINKSSSAAAVPYENAYNLRKWCLDKQLKVFGTVPFKILKNPAYVTVEDVKNNVDNTVENVKNPVEVEDKENEE